MRYPYPEIIALAQQDPTLIPRLQAVGHLDPSHMVIDLPANFDWRGLTPPPVTPMRGAGDLVALFAQPIARAIDATLGTQLLNCGGCSQRQEALNQAIPFKPARPDHATPLPHP